MVCSWDDVLGSVLDLKYPEEFEISDALINKVYMTHAYGKELKEEILEIGFEGRYIMSFCDKSRVPDVGYELVILVIHEKEKLRSPYFKKLLLEFGRSIIKLSKEERKENFLDNLEQFFVVSDKRKILLLGRPEAGKTTIQRVIFEGVNPNDLLNKPLKPTRGLTSSIYSWLDLELSIFDSAGQFFDKTMENENQQIKHFSKTDLILYVFDSEMWDKRSTEVINDIDKISQIIKTNSYEGELILLFHKTDLINEKTREQILNDVKAKLTQPVYFTSIKPDLIYSLYNAFNIVLSNFSEENFHIKQILDNYIKQGNILLFVTNEDNNIVAQSTSEDFNFNIINYTHFLIAQLNLTLDNIKANNEINHLILQTRENFNIIVRNLNLSEINVKNIICISETLNSNKLIAIAGEIWRELVKKLRYNR